MGRFKVRFKICSIRDPSKCKEIEGWVDTGSTVSIVPKAILKELGIMPIREQTFRLATSGIEVKRKVGHAIIKISVDGEELETASDVAFGQKDDETILGIPVLETLGIDIDPQKRKLVRSLGHL